MKRDTLEKQRAKRVAAAEARAGIEDGGLYRVTHSDGSCSWHRVHVQFYPRESWIVEDCDPNNARREPIKGTQRKLTDNLKSKFEDWL